LWNRVGVTKLSELQQMEPISGLVGPELYNTKAGAVRRQLVVAGHLQDIVLVRRWRQRSKLIVWPDP
jgi:hypothetical protein